VLHDSSSIYAVETEDGICLPISQMISTLPLGVLLRLIGEVPPEVMSASAALQTRSTVMVYLNLTRKTDIGFHYLTSFDQEYPFGRITFYRNWWPRTYTDANNEVIGIEYWCANSDEILTWPEDRLIQMACANLARTGIVRPDLLGDGHVLRLKGVIPVPHIHYQANLDLILNFLSQFSNLHIAGRHGRFRWDGQEEGIREGLELGKKVALSC
jgi:protoporphyrinogen oxidase